MIGGNWPPSDPGGDTDAVDSDGGWQIEVFFDGGWEAGPDVPAKLLYPQFALAGGSGSVVYSVDESLDVRAWDPASDAGSWAVIAERRAGPYFIDASCAPAAQFFAVIDGLAAGGDCTESDSEAHTFEFGGPDAGWGYIPGAPIARDTAAAAVSPDGRIFVFAGETRSACCIGEYGSVSFSYLGSYDVFDLDAGAWEPTHGG